MGRVLGFGLNHRQCGVCIEMACHGESVSSIDRDKWRALCGASVAVVLAAWMQASALAWPGTGQAVWWLQLLAALLLFGVLDRSTSPKAMAGWAWLFACLWQSWATSWLYTSLHVYGGLAAPLAVAAIVALSGFLALYFAAAAYAFGRLRQRWGLNRWGSSLLLLGLWMLPELMRHSWFGGFPWGGSGYAHVDGPLAFLAPWVGVYGIALVAHIWAMLLLRLLQWLQAHGVPRLQRRTLPVWRWPVTLYMAWCLLLLVLPGLLASQRLMLPSHAQPMQVDLLQGNIEQGEKFDMDTGVQESLVWYRQQLLASRADVVITPETAIPLLPLELPDGYWLELQQAYAKRQQAALVGLPLGHLTVGYRNAVVGLKPSTASTHYSYTKQHLVPFGEFIPPMFRWFTDLLQIPLGDFDRGERVQPSFAWRQERLAPNICYEDLFGDELAARFVQPEMAAPTVLVNMSNLGWFGTGKVLDQHLHMARMRSMELDRPTLRATNTGMTALIDRHGQVQAQLPRASQGVLRVALAGNHGLSFYASWAGRWGHWPLWGLAFTLVLLAWPWRSRKKLPVSVEKSVSMTASEHQPRRQDEPKNNQKPPIHTGTGAQRSGAHQRPKRSGATRSSAAGAGGRRQRRRSKRTR